MVLNHDDDAQKPLLLSTDYQVESNSTLQKTVEHQLQDCCCETILGKGRIVVLGEEHNAQKLICSVDLWLNYTAYFCGAIVGLVPCVQ